MRVLAGCGVILLLQAAQLARAQTPLERPRGQHSSFERARSLFWEATAAYRREEYRPARELFAKAHELEPGAATLRALGLCDFQLQDYVQAMQELRAALAEPRRTKALNREQQRAVNDLLSQLEPRVGQLRIETTPENVALEVDGTPVTGPELWLSAGPHTLFASAPGRESKSLRVAIDGGRTQRQSIALPPIAPAQPAKARPSDREPIALRPTATSSAPTDAIDQTREAARLRGIVGLGFAATSFLTGALTGYFSASITSDQQSRCEQGHCPLDSRGALNDANTLANVSNIAFALGGVGVAYGLYELLTLPKRAPASARHARATRVSLTPGGVLVQGPL